MWKNILNKLRNPENLTKEEAKWGAKEVFKLIERVDREAGEALIAFFGCLSIKGLTQKELSGLAVAMEESKKIKPIFELEKPLVSGGGTGGDTFPTINVTTPSSIIASSAGAIVAKSMAKSFSSKVGAEDLASALGINTHLPLEKIKQCIENLGLAMWSSLDIYPWMGPLIEMGRSHHFLTPFMSSLRLMITSAVNPFGAKRNIRGTSLPNTELIANTLQVLGNERALVPLGSGPGNTYFDEFSNVGPTIVSELRDNKIENYEVTPEDFGIKKGNPKEILTSGSAKINAKKILNVLSGEDRSSRRTLILINSAAVLYLAGLTDDYKDGYELSSQAVDSRKAISKLNELIRLTRE